MTFIPDEETKRERQNNDLLQDILIQLKIIVAQQNEAFDLKMSEKDVKQ